MENKSQNPVVKPRKRWKPPQWMVVLTVVVVAIIGFATAISVSNQVSKSAGEKLFESYLSAAKKSNVNDYIATVYSKGTEEYNIWTENYRLGVVELKEFLDQYEDGCTPQEFIKKSKNNTTGINERSSEGQAYWDRIASPADLKDYALRLELGRMFAENVKKYRLKTIRYESSYQEIQFTVTFKSELDVLQSYVPAQKFPNIKIGSDILGKFRKEKGSWHFASLFSLALGQETPSTWCVGYEDGLRLAYINPDDIDDGTIDIRELEQRFEGKILSIGDFAFADCGTDLEEVIFSTYIKHIGQYAFLNCTRLDGVGIRDTRIKNQSPEYTFHFSEATVLEEGAFYNCKALTDINIPLANKVIPAYLFYNCSSIETLTMSEGIEIGYVGAFAFYGCAKVKEVLLPASVTAVGDSVFRGCTALERVVEFVYPAGHALAGQTAINVLPETLTRLGGRVFEGTALTTVTLPESLTTLNRGLFKNAKNLEEVKFSQRLEIIDADVFANTAISDIQELTYIKSIGDNAFAGCVNLTGVSWGSKPQIRTIGAGAFSGCVSFTHMDLPETIKGIGVSAFMACTELRVVMVHFAPDISIGAGAFETADSIPKLYVSTKTSPQEFNRISIWNAMNLDIYSQSIIDEESQMAILPRTGVDYNGNKREENVLIQYLGKEENVVLPSVLPNGSKITHIGDGAFSHNKSVKKFSLGDVQLLGVGANVFQAGNPDFEWDRYEDISVPFRGALNYIGGWLFGVVKTGTSDLGTTLDISAAGASKFKLAGTEFEGLPETVGIAASAFAGARFNEIRLPKTLKYIGDNAFRNSSALNKIVIDNVETDSQLTSIGIAAFENCENLLTLRLPVALEEIGNYAFDGCTRLRYVIFDAEKIMLGVGAFRTSSDMLKLYAYGYDAADSVYKAGNWASYANIMYDIEIIKDGRFAVVERAAGGHTLVQYLGMEDLEAIDFSQESSLDGITIVEIGAGAFAKSNIYSIVISADVEVIAQNAFFWAEKLGLITIEALENGDGNLRSIGNYAFSRCTVLNVRGRINMEAIRPYAEFRLGNNVFDSNFNRKVYLEAGSRDFYEEFGWGDVRSVLNDELDPKINLSLVWEDGTEIVDNKRITVSPDRLIGEANGMPGEKITLLAGVTESNEATAAKYEFVRWEIWNGTAWETPENGQQRSYSFTFGEQGTTQTIRAVFKEL